MSAPSQFRLPTFAKGVEDAPSPITATSFPRFPELPTKIRLAIWGQFALPRKLYHIVRQDFNLTTEVILSDREGSRKRMDIRRIMQANTEARREVLQGHQLVVWAKSQDKQGRPQPSPSFSFVNWELDLFSVRLCNPLGKPLEKEHFDKIKNLAIGIESTFGSDGLMPDAEEMPYEYEHNPYRHRLDISWECESDDCCPVEWREASGSVERVVFIIPRGVVWDRMFIGPPEYLKYLKHLKCEVAGYPEAEVALRDGGDLPINEYGLHTVADPTDHIYDTCKAQLEVATEEPRVTRTFSFSQWVQMMIPIAKEQATHGQREVECQIMLDYLGYRDQHNALREKKYPGTSRDPTEHIIIRHGVLWYKPPETIR
ncbi:hypothetical protein F4782DRAFT_550760 [Xylaria castorea]|nr:hypothetical protein F4782DRAFT_550760 [Xylaria castorea]